MISLLIACYMVLVSGNPSDGLTKFSIDERGALISERQSSVGSGAPYWYGEITRQGKVAYGDNSSYVIFRNVKDFGAMGGCNIS